MSFSVLPTDLRGYIATFIPLKELKSFSTVDPGAATDALKSCFLELQSLNLLFPLCKKMCLHLHPDTSLDGQMRIILQSVYPFCHKHVELTLQSLPAVCKEIMNTVDAIFLRFMESLQITYASKEARHDLLEDTLFQSIANESEADKIRDFLFEHQKEIAALSGSLHLEDVSLFALSRELRYFKGIMKFEAIKCEISILPEEIVEMEALKELDVRDNQLRAIPKTLEQLKHLSEINLQGNQLQKFPKRLPDRTFCMLRGNPCFDNQERAKRWKKADADPDSDGFIFQSKVQNCGSLRTYYAYVIEKIAAFLNYEE